MQRHNLQDGRQQVWRSRTVYDSAGAIIHQETYYSNYARITGIVLVGDDTPALEPTPEPIPEPTPTPIAP